MTIVATNTLISARRHPLVAAVRARLRGQCGMETQSRLLVAVSGGADSLALLIACAMIRDTGGHAIEAAHVHHHLRREADDDAAHVKHACAQLDVPLHIEHVQPGDLPGNVSANARRLRYQVLHDAATRMQAAAVAVAHHAEDQLETMLMALCRGSGLSGLAAMNWQRPLGSDVKLVRPLLASSKAECEDLCSAAGMAWREDASNTDPRRARARLRRDVVPVLESLWPDASEHATHASELLRAASEIVNERLDEVFNVPATRWKRDDLRVLPVALIAAGLMRSVSLTDREKASQRQLMAAAEAVADDTKRPRTFELTRSRSLRISAQDVELVDVEQRA